ncbi:hypothetical protein J5TS2_36700 [Brevibacillus halotolerans]|uniref:hypothetical protein n=1 Tax=Brevibacillus halotolerans TaxID=1507437 RepID=UPI001B1147B7|nr:hypothetical protein [Brevibacillus halotolerans]GIO03002.1 hypothetical protein J5TS2_36700 [Brevibacillus halotolerans]
MDKQKEHRRKCPCGSDEFFDECCEKVSEGSTPEQIKRVVKRCVRKAFNDCNINRGEHCIYVSYVVKNLLELHGIRSYVVAGASKWIGYPIYYQWKPKSKIPEFHVWVVTQYGETVDLACEDIHNRSDFVFTQTKKLGIPSPSSKWNKDLSDCEYVPKELGAKSFLIDMNALNRLQKKAIEYHERYTNPK